VPPCYGLVWLDLAPRKRPSSSGGSATFRFGTRASRMGLVFAPIMTAEFWQRNLAALQKVAWMP